MPTRVQNLDEAVYISHCANTLGIGMNPTILPLVKAKIVGQTRIFKLGIATNQGEENSEFRPVKNHLKKDLGLHSARAEAFFIYIYIYTLKKKTTKN